MEKSTQNIINIFRNIFYIKTNPININKDLKTITK